MAQQRSSVVGIVFSSPIGTFQVNGMFSYSFYFAFVFVLLLLFVVVVIVTTQACGMASFNGRLPK